MVRHCPSGRPFLRNISKYFTAISFKLGIHLPHRPLRIPINFGAVTFMFKVTKVKFCFAPTDWVLCPALQCSCCIFHYYGIAKCEAEHGVRMLFSHRKTACLDIAPVMLKRTYNYSALDEICYIHCPRFM